MTISPPVAARDCRPDTGACTGSPWSSRSSPLIGGGYIAVSSYLSSAAAG